VFFIRIEAFEMWRCLKRLLRVSLTKHMSNEEVLISIGKQRYFCQYTLAVNECSQAMENIGHILRKPKYIFLKIILIEKIEEKRGPNYRQHS